MRMLILLWIGLTCVLGIYGDDMVKRAAEGSGGAQLQGSGVSGLPIAPDDEDYSSSYEPSSFSDSTDYGSGGGDYSQSESEYSEASDMTPSEETNVIKVHGEFKIDGIGGGKLEWMEALSDKTSNTFTEFSNLITPVIQRALEGKKSTRKGLQSVNILGFRHGSIIVEYEAVYGPDSKITGDQVRRSMKDAFGSPGSTLEVDPLSVSPADVIQPQPQGVIVTDLPPATTPKPKRPVATDPPMVPTTKANNGIIDIDPVKPKPDGKPDNEVGNGGGVIDIDETPEPNTEVNNEIPNEGKSDGHGGVNTKEESQMGFWDKLFSHPLILAGLVGGVVIALLTVVLLLMFVVYRLKKKDEGSYSLDEPHKVKDPMAYWKDTKEFYA